MYTPCSVAGIFSIITGPVVVIVVVVVVVVVIVDVSVDVTVLHIHLLFTVYSELGWHALLVVVGGVAVWYSVFVGLMTVVQSCFGTMLVL